MNRVSIEFLAALWLALFLILSAAYAGARIVGALI